MSDTPSTPSNGPASSKPWNDQNHFKCRGRIGNKPEVRSTRRNPVISCTVYIKNEYDDANQKRVTKTTRVPVTMFGDKGMTFANEVSKGDYVEIEGRLQENAWQDAQGQKRSRLELVASKYQVVQRKQGQAQAA